MGVLSSRDLFFLIVERASAIMNNEWVVILVKDFVLEKRIWFLERGVRFQFRWLKL